MLNKSKKAMVLIIVVFCSLNVISKEFPESEGYSNYFTLIAKCFTSRHMDYLNLMKHQLHEIGIGLDVHFINWSEVQSLSNLPVLRDMDLMIIDIFDMWELDPFLSDFFTENGSMNFISYQTDEDWDEELGTGKNEWFIKNGLQMISNDSQEQINHCWEWQHYMMNELLPCLPLFTHTSNNSTYDLLFYNLHESRPVIGNDNLAVGNTDISIGLAIRKAISYAINKEEIRKVVLGDEYEVIHHPTNPTMSDWLNPDSIRYCYNLNVARELVYIAGFQVGWWEVTYPDWETICPNSPPSVSVAGFNMILSLGVLLVISIPLLFKKLKNKKHMKKILIKK